MAFNGIGGKIISNRTISDLPTPIFVDILLKVPVEKILICKRVCKSWRKIISDPQFGTLYFSGNDVHVLLHPSGTSPLSKKLFFFDPENYKWIISHKFGCNLEYNIHFNSFDVMFNTCNGFICFATGITLAVANPVTEELVRLPMPIGAEEERNFVCGLGFCRVTNKYKVVRIYGCDYSKRWTNCPATIDQCSYSSYAQVLTLGSEVWENVCTAPSYHSLRYSVFLNGALYWSCDPILGSKYIISFDFTYYHFKTYQLPPAVQSDSHLPRIGVMKDHICCCDGSKYDRLELWLMSEISSEGGWTKVCNVSLTEDLDTSQFGFFQPITSLKSGAIVLFHCNKKKSGILYYEPESKWLEYIPANGATPKYMRKYRASKQLHAIHFRPTLVSLKDVFIGDREYPSNDQPRSAELDIQGENNFLLMMQAKIAGVSRYVKALVLSFRFPLWKAHLWFCKLPVQ